MHKFDDDFLSSLLHSYNYIYELLIVCNVSHTQLIVLLAQFYTYLKFKKKKLNKYNKILILKPYDNFLTVLSLRLTLE